eukprot:scaffold30614_cov63-Phaeocystis_antarctica.AAC.5
MLLARVYHSVLRGELLVHLARHALDARHSAMQVVEHLVSTAIASTAFRINLRTMALLNTATLTLAILTMALTSSCASSSICCCWPMEPSVWSFASSTA